jgi:hypothetical protein
LKLWGDSLLAILLDLEFDISTILYLIAALFIPYTITSVRDDLGYIGLFPDLLDL